MRIIKALLIGVLILIGILLISNINRGFETFEQDKIRVYTKVNMKLADVVAAHPQTAVVDADQRVPRLVSIPYGEAGKWLPIFRQDKRVAGADTIPLKTHFSMKKYTYEIQSQVKQLLNGNFGHLIYTAYRPTDPPREVPINPQLGKMVARTLSYLVPGLALGLLLGYALSCLAAWKQKVGQVLDAFHAVLLGLPDFFVVVLLQMLGILLAKAMGHNVYNIMQFGDQVPFLIPFLAIAILPGAILYGTLRLAVQREWDEGYIKTAHAKGLSRTQVLYTHILRNTAHDLLAVLPRAVSVAVTSLVVAEVMCAIIGLGGYSVDRRLAGTTALPATCAILAAFVMVTHLLVAVLKRRLVVHTKEGA